MVIGYSLTNNVNLGLLKKRILSIIAKNRRVWRSMSHEKKSSFITFLILALLLPVMLLALVTDTRLLSFGQAPVSSPITPPITPPYTPTPTIILYPTVVPQPTPTPTRTPTPSPTPTVIPIYRTIIIPVKSGRDDINQEGKKTTTTRRDIWLGTGKLPNQSYTGLRFTNVLIPKDSQIVSAKLKVYSRAKTWEPMNFIVYGEASDNSAAFRGVSRPSSRIVTDNQAQHISNVQWQANTWYTVIDARPMVQEIVNREGWKSGNNLTLILKGNGSQWARKYVAAYEAGANIAPRLVITLK